MRVENRTQSNATDVSGIHSPIPTHNIDIRTNPNTWALPEGAIVRFGKGLENALAFSPDGKFLAVGTMIGVWWYDVSTWSPIALWETERGVISALAFSPNGQRLSTGNLDGEIKIWDVQIGSCITKIQRPRQRSRPSFTSELAINQIVSSGKYIAVSSKVNGVIYIWHSDTGEQIAKLSTEPEIALEKRRNVPRPLCFSPDGHLLACASPADTAGDTDFIALWDMKTLEHIASIRDYTTQVDTLCFSPCGNFLAAGDAAGTLKEWEVTTGKQTKKQLKVSSEYPRYYQVLPAYTQSGQLRAAGQHGSTIAIWDVESGEKLDVFDYDWYIFSYHFLDGTHLALRNPLKVWIENSPYKGDRLLGHRSISYSPTFSADGKTLFSDAAYCWNVSEKRFERYLYNDRKTISHIYIAPTGEMRALGGIRGANIDIVWDVEMDKTIATFENQAQLRDFAFSPTGTSWVSGDEDGNLYVRDESGDETILSGHTRWVKTVAFHPDGQQLVSISSDDTVRLWDVVSGEELVSLPTGRLDRSLYLGDARQIQSFKKPRESVTIQDIVFSPCGNIIAGGLFEEIRLWDATKHVPLMAMVPPLECRFPYSLAFSPCGQYLASGSWWSGTPKVSIRLWEVATGENVATLWGHPTDVESLTFSPDGTVLASGSYDGTILLWDLKPYL